MDLSVVAASALGVAVFHTVVGVDHSLPFVVLARAQNWSLRRLWVVTAACGLVHVASSIVLAAGAVGLGIAADEVLTVEGSRGSIAAWLLILFGTTYTAWAVWRTLRGEAHQHAHAHEDGTVHDHGHDHRGQHLHMHAANKRGVAAAAALFIVFIFGPCEFLIAPVMAAYQHGWGAVAFVAGTFAFATIATMLVTVTIGYVGLGLRRFVWLERHMHAIAGVTIALSGVAIEFLGV